MFVSTAHAFIPLQHPACAWRRLQKQLTAKQRRALYFNLARRMIVALRALPRVREVVVVTSSAEVEMLAGHLGVRVMHQLRDAGVNSALEAAITAFAAAGTTTALIVPGDLPLVTSESLDALLQAAETHGRGVTLVPDRHHQGTNALVCTPADAIRPRFGPNSFAEHLRSAQQHGLPVRIFECGPLALDLDDSEDLRAWQACDLLPWKHSMDDLSLRNGWES
jgi:2-phospho-L-lactate/phosphoenolpyruvate guanylyltransferase